MTAKLEAVRAVPMSTHCWAFILEGLGPADHQGKLQSTCYLLRAAVAQVRTRWTGQALFSPSLLSTGLSS